MRRQRCWTAAAVTLCRALWIPTCTSVSYTHLAGAVKPGLVIPMHYDAYAGNLENPLLFQDYLHVKYPDVPCAVPRAGERLDVEIHHRNR